MTKNPSKTVRIQKLETDYGAPFFRDALARFAVQHCHPEYSRAQVENAANIINLNFACDVHRSFLFLPH